MTMSNKGLGSAGALVRSNHCEHLVWQQRVSREERDAIVSLQHGVELGMVPQISCVRSTSVPPADKFREKDMTKLIGGYGKEQRNTKNIMGYGSINLNVVKQSLNTNLRYNNNQNLRSVLHKYHLTPFGLYPLSKPTYSTNKPVERVGSHAHVRTAKHTYMGPAIQPYMKSSIDITQPDYDKVNVDMGTTISKIRKLMKRNDSEELKDILTQEKSKRPNFGQTAEIKKEGTADFIDKNSAYFSIAASSKPSIEEMKLKRQERYGEMLKSRQCIGRSSRHLSVPNCDAQELFKSKNAKPEKPSNPSATSTVLAQLIKKKRTFKRSPSSKKYCYPDLRDPISLLEGIKIVKNRYKIGKNGISRPLLLSKLAIVRKLPPLEQTDSIGQHIFENTYQ